MGNEWVIILLVFSAACTGFLIVNEWFFNLITIDQIYFWILFSVGIASVIFGILSLTPIAVGVIWIPIVFCLLVVAFAVIAGYYIYINIDAILNDFSDIVQIVIDISKGDFSSLTDMIDPNILKMIGGLNDSARSVVSTTSQGASQVNDLI